MKRHLPNKEKMNRKRLRRLEKTKRAVERSLVSQAQMAFAWSTDADRIFREKEKAREKKMDLLRRAGFVPPHQLTPIDTAPTEQPTYRPKKDRWYSDESNTTVPTVEVATSANWYRI